MMEFGEMMVIFKLIFQYCLFLSKWFDQEGKEIVFNYLMLYNKWFVYSMYFDFLLMLMLFCGGLIVWMNKDDVEDMDIKDNDWIECFN